MGMVVEGAGPSDSDANLIVRVTEDLYGTSPWAGGSNKPQGLVFMRGAKTDGNANFSLFSGGGTALGFDTTGLQAEGRNVVRILSNGAATRWRRGGNCSFPLSQAFATMTPALLGRPLRSYSYQATVMITALGAGTSFEFSLADADTGIVMTGTRNGPLWRVAQAINGGRWLPQYRRLNAGVLDSGPDSGATALNQWHLLVIKYYEGVTPRIDWLLDGRIIHSVSGAANMPTYAGGGTLLPGWLPFQGCSQVAGMTVLVGETTYEVRNIS